MRMPITEARKFIGLPKNAFYTHNHRYYQDVKDIQVITNISPQNFEITNTLEGEDGSRKTKLNTPSEHDYILITTNGIIEAVREGTYTRNTYYRRQVQCEEDTMAHFCSYLQEKGFTKVQAFEMLMLHWNEVEKAKEARNNDS
jgi:hypothetical protein